MASRSPLSQSLIKLKPQLLEKWCLKGVRLDALTAKVHREPRTKSRSRALAAPQHPEGSAEGADEVTWLWDKQHEFTSRTARFMQVSCKSAFKTAFSVIFKPSI